MYATICPPIQICPTLLDGLNQLAETAAKVYGNQKKLSYLDKSGRFCRETHFSTVLSEMVCSEQNVQAVVGILTQQGCPKDGVKTAVLLLSALLHGVHTHGIQEQDFHASITPMTTYMKEYLQRIDRQTQKGLPGGGLYLINLARPLDSFANNNPQYAMATRLMVAALAEPLKTLAKNAKLDPCEVYERVKALAPNQFFSLNHFGLERSIDRENTYTDVIEYGVDLADQRIKNLLDANITVSLQTAYDMLDYVADMAKEICAIADFVF